MSIERGGALSPYLKLGVFAPSISMTVGTAEYFLAKKGNERMNEGKPWSTSCSLMESIRDTCETVGAANWIKDGATDLTAAAVGVVGTNAIFVHIHDSVAAGLMAHSKDVLWAADDVSLASDLWTHLAFRAWGSKGGGTVALSAGDFQIGLDNADDGATAKWADIPALSITDKKRIQLPLTAFDVTERETLTSVDSVAIRLAAAAVGVTNLYIDDIRLVKLTNDGDSLVTLAESHTESDARAYVLNMPFDCDEIISIDGRVGTTIGRIPKATNIQVVSNSVVGTLYRLAVGEVLENEEVAFDQLIITPQADLGSTDYIDIRVREQEAI